jgi:hypothetical protein
MSDFVTSFIPGTDSLPSVSDVLGNLIGSDPVSVAKNVGSVASTVGGLTGSTSGSGTPTANSGSANTTSGTSGTGSSAFQFAPLKANVVSGNSSGINLGDTEASVPMINSPTTAFQPNPDAQVTLATGGSVDFTPHVVQGNPNFNLGTISPRFHDMTDLIPNFAEGGSADGGPENVPRFFSEGGLQNTYVKGDGDGTSDSVPAMLANGEFVIPADVVSALGNGSNDSGSKVLDSFLQTVRDHKQQHDPKELPPDSKGPLGYLHIAELRIK